MRLLDRYLDSVAFWLPKKHKDDILAELAEDLQTAIEERSRSLGRPLTEEELAELLKRRGHPMLVAGQYSPRGYLIGPALFPAYRSVLKMAALFGIVPWVLVWAVVLFYVPGAAQAYPTVASKLLVVWEVLWVAVPLVFAVITAIFAFLERTNKGTLRDWDPKDLRPAAAEIPRSRSVFELAASLVFCIWWVAAMSSREVVNLPTVHITLAPAWAYFFWGFLAVALFNSGLAAFNLVRPQWSRGQALLRLVSDLCGSALFCVMLSAHLMFSITVAGVSAERTAAIAVAFNVWAARMLPIGVIIGAVIAVVNLRRLWRLKTHAALLARAAITLALALAVAAGARAQANGTTALPTDADIRHILADRIDVQHKSVGMVVGITSPAGRRIVVYGAPAKGAGQLNGDTVFEIGSVTKIFTALLLADMVEHGEVALGDSVTRYLPPGSALPERNGRSITLLDLATQTSGLPFFPPEVPLNDVPAAQKLLAGYDRDRLYRFLSQYQLPDDIGSKWQYSNVGFAVLGDALAHRAGTDYETLLRKRITAPLGMSSTTISLSAALRARTASGHDAHLQPAAEVNMPAFLPAGCLHSTANDLLTFLEAFLGLKKTELQPAMQRMISVRRPGPGFQQALGWWVVSLGSGDDGFIFHGGQTPGFSSAIAYDPKSKTGIVVLSNDTENDGGLSWHLMRASFPVATSDVEKARQARLKEEIRLDAESLAHYVGDYRVTSGSTVGDVIQITHGDGFLLLSSTTNPSAKLRLHAQSERLFFAPDADVEVKFEIEAGRRAAALTIRFAGADTEAKRIDQ